MDGSGYVVPRTSNGSSISLEPQDRNDVMPGYQLPQKDLRLTVELSDNWLRLGLRICVLISIILNKVAYIEEHTDFNLLYQPSLD